MWLMHGDSGVSKISEGQGRRNKKGTSVESRQTFLLQGILQQV